MNFFSDKILFIDGAMGTMLGKTEGLPEILNVTEPDRIKKIHTAYLDSGANIITANTFGANRLKLEGSGYSVEQIVAAGVQNAHLCVSGRKNTYTSLDIGPLGTLLAPMGTLSFDEAYDIFAQTIRAAGDRTDFISVETMTDTYELKAAVLAAKENSSLPVIATFSLDENGKMLCGADIISVVSMLEGLRADALGLNCGLGPKQFAALYGTLKEYCSIPTALLPNAGMPYISGGETVYDTAAEEFAQYMKEFALGGVRLLGGCCGTTPEHIRRMTELCEGITPAPVTQKNHTVVSSYGKSVIFGEKPLIVGERINPTGKKKLKEALKAKDIDYILREGILQTEAGADILDVNVGLPEIDEKEMMERAVFHLQSILPTPLQLDSSSPAVLERSMRIYNGKPMINSVNGKEESMRAVFPLVQKYGGVVVALTLDESGIPETAQGRAAIAEKIIARAQTYGIPKKDIVVDTLTLTVSSDSEAPVKTLDALKTVSEKLGVKTILGVSNVSFGIPQREKVNRSFLTLALCSGLSCAILNPLSEDMMSSVFAFNVLRGYDKDCREYVKRYSLDESVREKTGAEDTLKEIIISGLKAAAYAKTKELLAGMEPLEIINEHIIPALDIVGKGFEDKKVFLPGLLSSAETAQNAFEALKEGAAAQNDGEKIILATVKGDIHDIGKNIVKLLLANYGYSIIDLGRDVPPEDIAAAAKKENVKLVGLSALMTTTVVSMEETIKALKASGHKCRVMVGGAVLTPEYADMIGADFYARDAMSAVAIARECFDVF